MNLNRSFIATLTDPPIEYTISRVSVTGNDDIGVHDFFSSTRPLASDLMERPFEDLKAEVGSWPPNKLFTTPLRAVCRMPLSGSLWGPGEAGLVCLTRRYLGVRCDAQYPPAQLRRWVGTLATSCASEGSPDALGYSQR